MFGYNLGKSQEDFLVQIVRQERTGWRDEALSQRHREWGWNCPAVDIDFLMLEYDAGIPQALVEYKHESANPQDPNHPSYRALRHLANSARIPFFAVRYKSDFSWWSVRSLNEYAKQFIPFLSTMTENEYIALLYEIRGRQSPTDGNIFTGQ